jgi:hypothetical protein
VADRYMHLINRKQSLAGNWISTERIENPADY